MSGYDKNSKNILELPNEILSEILCYVPDQLTVGLVCKTFYNISLRLVSYRLNISNGTSKRMFVDIEENEEIYQSILDSGRKIESLFITSENEKKTTLNRLRLRKVIEHIGGNVKELQIIEKSFNIHGVALLNLMPNIQKIVLCYNSCEGLKVPQNFQLRLNNLKELDIKEMSEKIFEVFERLPENVLDRLVLERIDITALNSILFGNQRNLKIVELQCDVDSFNLHQLKLKSLKAPVSTKNFRKVLRGQDELTSLHVRVDPFNQEMLDFVCTEMKLLENLIFESYVTENIVDLSKIRLLQNLKKLSLRSSLVENLKKLRSTSLQCLEIFELPEDAEFPPFNCPNLREFTVWSFPERFRVDEFLRHFSKLENFSYARGSFKFAEGWENQSLKNVSKICFETSNTIGFLKCCKNLKSFSSTIHHSQEVRKLLTEVPNLKTLHLKGLDEKSAEIIKYYGGSIESIQFQWYTPDNQIAAKVKEILKDQFPVCKIKRDVHYVHLFMKRY